MKIRSMITPVAGAVLLSVVAALAIVLAATPIKAPSSQPTTILRIHVSNGAVQPPSPTRPTTIRTLPTVVVVAPYPQNHQRDHAGTEQGSMH